MIHFPFARRIPRKAERQQPEPGFSALEPWEYRKDLDLEPEADALVCALYDDLCGLCHPTASAAEWLYQTTPKQLIRLREGGDERKLEEFLQKHRPAIAAQPLLERALTAIYGGNEK
jgi:hypothetical protein